MPTVSPDRYQPPLRAWSHAWRILLCLALSAVVWATVIEGQLEHQAPLFWIDIALGAVAYVLVFFRRRWPVTTAVLTCLLGSASAVAAGPATLALVSLATRRQLVEILPVAVLNLVSAMFFTTTQPVVNASETAIWLDLVLNVAAISAAVAWGMYIGSRRELLWTLRDRVERAESEQELRAAKARGDERARIAREMHDALGHRISQISMHAGALAFRDDLDANALRTGAAEVQARANEALHDLRGILGVLRDQGTGELVEAPQPTYADLSRLIADARTAGQRVEFDDAVTSTEEMPDRVGRTLYRLVQEALTNARKHAPSATVSIKLTGDEKEGVELVVRNPIGFGRPGENGEVTPGGGLGLVGLAERAELTGGRLDARRVGSTFVLRGWIPWTV